MRFGWYFHPTAQLPLGTAPCSLAHGDPAFAPESQANNATQKQGSGGRSATTAGFLARVNGSMVIADDFSFMDDTIPRAWSGGKTEERDPFRRKC